MSYQNPFALPGSANDTADAIPSAPPITDGLPLKVGGQYVAQEGRQDSAHLHFINEALDDREYRAQRERELLDAKYVVSYLPVQFTALCRVGWCV